MPKEKTLKDTILDFIYITSKQPILLKDLLVANAQYNEGMHVEPAKLGFRIRLTRAYIVYIALVLAIITPLSYATHTSLQTLGTHTSLLSAMFLTAAIFIGFNFFRAKLRDAMSQTQIKRAWKIHFPFFPYEEYSIKIEKIFEKAMKEEISKRDLEKYIIDNLND